MTRPLGLTAVWQWLWRLPRKCRPEWRTRYLDNVADRLLALDVIANDDSS
jgi:hypothetical protein